MIVYLLNIAIIGLIVYFIHKQYKSADLSKLFLPALILKVIAGVGIGWLFFHHYGVGDTISYHQDATKLSNIMFDDINKYLKMLIGQSQDVDTSQFAYYHQPRAFFLVKILSLVHLLSGQSYWISSVYFSLFSFTGFWILANTLVRHFPASKLGITVALLFFPSVVFWSSGIIKESIAMGAMTLLIKLLIDWLVKRQLDWKQILISAFLLFLVWNLKYYYLGVFLIVAVPLVITDMIVKSDRIKINTYIVYSLFFVIFIGLVSLLHPNFHLSNIVQVIVDNHNVYVLKSQPNQVIHYEHLEATWLSIAYNFPLAIWSGLFRMGIWEADHLFEYIVGLENLILLIFTLTAFSQWYKVKSSPNKLLILAASIYVVLLAGFLALSAPNLGTLARYQAGFLPVMILLITCDNPLLSFLKSKFISKVEDIS